MRYPLASLTPALSGRAGEKRACRALNEPDTRCPRPLKRMVRQSLFKLVACHLLIIGGRVDEVPASLLVINHRGTSRNDRKNVTAQKDDR